MIWSISHMNRAFIQWSWCCCQYTSLRFINKLPEGLGHLDSALECLFYKNQTFLQNRSQTCHILEGQENMIIDGNKNCWQTKFPSLYNKQNSIVYKSRPANQGRHLTVNKKIFPNIAPPLHTWAWWPVYTDTYSGPAGM